MVNDQAFLFLIFSINGALIGLFFDFFRILRRTFKTLNFITYIEDILFWICTGISIIYCMYNFANGDLRLYMFLGLAMGIILYMLALSKLVMGFFVTVILVIKQALKNVLNIFIFPLQKIFNFINKIIINPIMIIVFSKKNDKIL